MSKKAMQMALEALERMTRPVKTNDETAKYKAVTSAITALRAALSQQGEPAQQEPVRRQFQGRDGRWHDFLNAQHEKNTIEDGTWPIRGLYPAPAPAQPLPAHEIVTMYEESPTSDSDMIEFARAVERAHGIGETP